MNTTPESVNNPAAPDRSNVNLVYILYLASLVVGITGIVGVILAYINKGKPDADEIAQNHYRYQIRTFWIGVLYGLIGAALSVVLIGFLVLIFLVIWMIVRCVKGIQAAGRNEPVDNVTSWMF